jgi:DNA-binding PadR family transcriptional regulator
LLEAKVISEVEGPRDDDPRRRYYTITPYGRQALTEELNRMEDALALARRKPSDVPA